MLSQLIRTAMKINVYIRVNNNVYIQVNNNVYIQVNNNVYIQVNNNVYIQMNNNVYIRVNNNQTPPSNLECLLKSNAEFEPCLLSANLLLT